MAVMIDMNPDAHNKSNLVVFGGQKFRSLVSDQSFSRKTPQMKKRNVATHAKTDDVFHGHLFNKKIKFKQCLCFKAKHQNLLITNEFSNQKNNAVNQK